MKKKYLKKILPNIWYYQKLLPDLVILKRSRCTVVRFKPIIDRNQAHNSFFVFLATQSWKTLPANIVNMAFFLKFSEELNKLV